MRPNEFPAAPLERKNAKWYYFQDNAVGGPTLLENILRLKAQGEDGKDTLVCRTDFKKWYPLRDLSHLLKTKEEYGRETAQDLAKFNEVINQNLVNLQTLQGKADKPAPGKVEKKTISPAPQTPTQQTTPNLNQEQRHYQYYLLKSRLRLGRIQGAFSSAFIKWPLSLTLFSLFWLKSNFLELTWHAYNTFEFQKKLPPLAFSLLPGFHSYFIVKLASLLRSVEEQNGYKKTSPVIAGILSLLPPLAVFYLQRKINFHWQMHVEHYNAAQTPTSQHKSR